MITLNKARSYEKAYSFSGSRSFVDCDRICLSRSRSCGQPCITDGRTDYFDFCLPGSHSSRNPLGRQEPKEVRAISSVGSEQLPYKQRVSGSNPLSPRMGW